MRRSALALLLGCLLLVAGASALDGYDYYQTIEYAACDQEIYQQDIVIHRSTGTAYNETAGGLETWHIFVGDHCQADYDDVRFTNSTGELAYYLWPDFDSSSARFAVRLEGATSAGEVTAWYGNASATTTSNSSIVFTAYHGAASATFYDTPTVVFSQMRYDARVKYTRANYNLLFGLADAPISSPHDYVDIQLFTNNIYFYSKNNNVGNYVSIPYSLSLNTWYDISILHNGTTVSGYINGTKIGDWSTNLPDEEVGLFYWAAAPAGSQAYSLIRAYSATPPAATTFSGEQSSAAPPATAFPGITALPRDLAGTGLYTDINGNNRLDYNDLTVFFQHLAWAKANQPTECFDFNGNGWLDYNDVITLFTTISGEHP